MNRNLIISKGILKFDPPNLTKKHDKQGSWKKTAMVFLNDDTSRYYQWFIERKFSLLQGKDGKSNWLNSPIRGAHVTIINDRIDDMDVWDMLQEKYHNTEVNFFYDIQNGLRNNGNHIYYKVECPMGDVIRKCGNLGDPYFGFHLTIGRVDNMVYKKSHIERVQKYMINGN